VPCLSARAGARVGRQRRRWRRDNRQPASVRNRIEFRHRLPQKSTARRIRSHSGERPLWPRERCSNERLAGLYQSAISTFERCLRSTNGQSVYDKCSPQRFGPQPEKCAARSFAAPRAPHGGGPQPRPTRLPGCGRRANVAGSYSWTRSHGGSWLWHQRSNRSAARSRTMKTP